MSELDRDLEYLLWYEPHRQRWVAAPIVRSGPLILETEYGGAIPLYSLDDSLDGGADRAEER